MCHFPSGNSPNFMNMMKLRSPSSLSWDESCSVSRVFRVLLYSTQTLTTNQTASPPTLYHRLVPFGNPSMAPVLDQWVDEGRFVDQQELHKIIKQLRKFGRHKHALQICEWMNDKPFLDATYKTIALQLELISKVHGLELAEKYFEKIPKTSRVWQVYGALLKCYANARSLEKAEATMERMRELGCFTLLNCNIMLGLYSALEKYDKIDLLTQEMELKGVQFDRFTYAIRLKAHANSCEIRRMEKLLLKMEADPEVTMDWHPYTAVAHGYLKAGDKEKALEALRKSEYVIRPSQRKPAYEILLTLYASLGSKDDVYRIWSLYNHGGPNGKKFYNQGYLCMMSSLAKLGSLDEVEKLYDEWEKRHTHFDHRVPNFLITTYCKGGFLDKAESVVKKLAVSGNEPGWSTWSRMMLGYVKNGSMDKAVETLRKCVSGSGPGWAVDAGSLSACLGYLESKGDLDGAEEIIRSLERKGLLSETLYKEMVTNLSKESQI